MTPASRSSASAPALGGKAGWFAWAAPSAFVLTVYVWIVFATVWEPAVTASVRQPYNLQTEAFRRGQASLPVSPPAGLLQLADPYDPVQNASYRAPSGNAFAVHDLSLYRAKLYLYFGPTPVVVVFEPWLLLTGRYFPEELAVLFFCSAGFLLSAWLYRRLIRAFFPNARPLPFGTGVIALGFVSGLPTLLLRPAVYEVAISCGHAFVMLALVLVWRAIERKDAWRGWLPLASFAFGLAIAARPPLLFAALVLLIPVMANRRKDGAGSIVHGLFDAAAPIAAVGVLIMLYNEIRFENPFEFGQGYQLASLNVRQQPTLFSPDFVFFNLRLYFWEPVRWSAESLLPMGIQMPMPPRGYLGAENPFGILTSVPFVFLALALPLRNREKGGGRSAAFAGIQAALWVAFISAALTLCTFGGACSRYETEFLPALVLLAALGFIALDERLAHQKLFRWFARGFCGLLLAYSAAVGLLVGASAVSPHVSIRNRDLLALLEAGRKEEAVKGFEAHVRHYPTNAASHANLGTAYFETGRLQEAVRSYQRALNTDPTMVEVYNNLGVTFGQLGRIADARVHFKRALALSPGYRDAADNLARLEQKAAAEPAK
jgi:TPR repeat